MFKKFKKSIAEKNTKIKILETQLRRYKRCFESFENCENSAARKRVLEDHDLYNETRGQEGVLLDLSHCNLAGATFVNTTFTEANFSQAKFFRANFKQAEFLRAKFVSAVFTDVRTEFKNLTVSEKINAGLVTESDETSLAKEIEEDEKSQPDDPGYG